VHNFITERTPEAPWRRRDARLVRASRTSFGWVPGARAVQLAKPNYCQILVRNGVFGGYGRALTQNDGRAPRKLVDEDRAVGLRRARTLRVHRPVAALDCYVSLRRCGAHCCQRRTRPPSTTAAARPRLCSEPTAAPKHHPRGPEEEAFGRCERAQRACLWLGQSRDHYDYGSSLKKIENV